MLVLTRKKGESLMIGENIELTILEIEGDAVKVGINAPRSVGIYRREVYLSIQQSNKEASETTVDLNLLSKQLRKPEKE